MLLLSHSIREESFSLSFSTSDLFFSFLRVGAVGGRVGAAAPPRLPTNIINYVIFHYGAPGPGEEHPPPQDLSGSQGFFVTHIFAGFRFLVFRMALLSFMDFISKTSATSPRL